MTYRYRIQNVLNRVIKVADRKNGQHFRFITERSLDTVYESAWLVPAGYSILNVRPRLKTISAACGAIVELDDRGGVIIIRVVIEDLPKHVHFVESDLRPDRLLIGYYRQREPVYHPLHSHLLVGGASGAGKTDFLRLVIYQLVLQGYDVRIVDMKGFSFMPFEAVPGITVARNPIEAMEMLAKTFRELERREQLVIQRRNRDIIKSFRPIVMIVDEAAQIAPGQNSGDARKIAKVCDEYCAKISQKGREPRVQLIYCTQRPDADIVNPQVKANVEAAIAFRCKTRTNSTIILDRPGAEEISPDTPGRCIYSSTRDIMTQVPYVGDDDDWNELLIPLKTEVEYEGRSTRRAPAHVEFDADHSDQARSLPIPRQRVALKKSFSRTEGAGEREADRGPTTGRHEQSLAIEPPRPHRTGDTAEVDPAWFA